MAVYDLEEQDQIDELKAWWARYGGAVTVGLVLAVLVIGGVQGWRWWSGKRAEDASVLYSAVSDAARAKDPAKAKDAMTQITDQLRRHRATRRARRCCTRRCSTTAAIATARRRSTRGRPSTRRKTRCRRSRASASRRCRSTRSSTTRRSPRSTRSIRTRSTACSPTCAAMRWQPPGRVADARTAYETALAKLDPKSPYRNYVQVKHDALGGAAPAAAAAPTVPPAASDTGRRRRRSHRPQVQPTPGRRPSGSGQMTRLHRARALGCAAARGSAGGGLREHVRFVADVVDARHSGALVRMADRRHARSRARCRRSTRRSRRGSTGSTASARRGRALRRRVTASAVYAAAKDGTLTRLDRGDRTRGMASQRRAPAVGGSGGRRCARRRRHRQG